MSNRNKLAGNFSGGCGDLSSPLSDNQDVIEAAAAVFPKFGSDARASAHRTEFGECGEVEKGTTFCNTVTLYPLTTIQTSNRSVSV